MLRDFATGFGMLGRGFRMWRTHPRLLGLGLIPAVIAGVVLLAALIPLALSLGGLATWATPFADAWASPWREILRVVLGVAVFIVAVGLAGAVFTALAMTIGDPFYQRIWRGVERSLGGPEPVAETGFWASITEGLRLVALGVLVAILTFAIGLVPLVGAPIAAVLGVALSGRLLARELTGRAFDARGIESPARAALLRTGAARVLGFGVATQLCFLVPLGAVVTMPAAVAGSTILARSLLDPRSAPSGPGRHGHGGLDSGVSAGGRTPPDA